MAISRTWKLHLNLDEFNALTLSLYQDSDRALAFQGLALGFNGSPLPCDVPGAFVRGWNLGKATRDEAESFRESRKTNGMGGGRPSHRKEPHGIPHGLPNGIPCGEPVGIPYGLPNPITTSDDSKPENQKPETDKKQPQQPAPFVVSAASESQPVTVTPRARPANATAAPGWSAETAKEIREARASDRRQKWILAQAGQVDFTVRPSILQFLSYCRAVHPSWHERAAREAFDTWATHNWTFERRKISSWWQLTDAFAFAADHSEHNERVPMGGVVAGLGIADQLSAKAAGLTTGERI